MKEKHTEHSQKNKYSSRISGFYKLSVNDRLKLLYEKDIITEQQYLALLNGDAILSPEQADKMIENVVSIFGLPFALGLNFYINGRDYIVPMVVEEPSIVAATSAAAKIVRDAGGFYSTSMEPVLIGQIQVVNIESPAKAQHAILQNKDEILNLANSLHPKMVARGGGAKDLEVILHTFPGGKRDMLIVHLLVDTRDAMGANLVNSMCEGVASLIEKITNGEVFLRILSNLADRSLVKAECTIPVKLLEGNGFSGEEVRDGIIMANDFALVDPYRAATHNKGIMNGIDPVAIATGNDWRAIEAGAHAYAARSGQYTSLTQWMKNDNGDLVGSIKLPIKVGIVGGPVQSNPMVKIAHQILGIQTARELGEVMAAVGLAQNFSAIKALSTEGIQRGHMSLHARSVAMAAGTPPEYFEEVVDELIHCGEIKIWKAEEILAKLIEKKSVVQPISEVPDDHSSDLSAGHGKVILLGEHAVVYGRHAIAAPINLAIQAKVEEADDGIHLVIPRWGVEEKMHKGMEHKYSIYASLDMILSKLALIDKNMRIEIFPNIPRAMGLGGSAALAVSIIRALSEHYKLNLTNEEINDMAYQSEMLAHGNASGIDNTLATYGKFLLFKKGEPPEIKEIHPPKSIPIVIGLTGVESLTAKMVAKVQSAWQNNQKLYEKIFDDIDQLTMDSIEAIQNYDLHKLGELMNINQGLLNALQVSSSEIEELIAIARRNGAIGAKLTGGGGGGAMIAICPNCQDQVVAAMRKAGYEAIATEIG
ncbi:MAG: hypothetical protein Kow00108_01420 [Calditrichia bacterium]